MKGEVPTIPCRSCGSSRLRRILDLFLDPFAVVDVDVADEVGHGADQAVAPEPEEL